MNKRKGKNPDGDVLYGLDSPDFEKHADWVDHTVFRGEGKYVHIRHESHVSHNVIRLIEEGHGGL